MRSGGSGVLAELFACLLIAGAWVGAVSGAESASLGPGVRRDVSGIGGRTPSRREQPYLAVQAARVSGQGAVGADHPVAGADDQQRVGADRAADGPDGGAGRRRSRAAISPYVVVAP